ncbi:hypothetical protein B0H13DRAFT_1641567 [Mycena leptocephala]|nr:hypothetical protein B0H13DRAFT_1641567 [Mycena leptocephala]
MQDNPGILFPQVQQLFLEETLRHAGLGDSLHHQECALCHCNLDRNDTGEGPRIFRCAPCGVFLQCEKCCLERHSLTPLHLPSEWKGQFWEPTTLGSLGLVYQLGHEGGRCKYPAAQARSLVVMDVDAIHTIKYRLCSCDRSDTSNNLRQMLRNGWYPASATDPDTCATFKSLDLFRLLNVIGNVNGQDFVRALEHNSSAMGLEKVPDRYKTFLRMSRQYAWLERIRHAGLGHRPEGLQATKAGKSSVICWTCPFEGRNLPDGWREVKQKSR